MIEVKRKEKESTSSLLRRFNKRVRQSGVLLSALKNMYYERPKNKRQQKTSALRRERLRKLRRKLVKTGELDPREKIDLSKIRE
jgi:ribosomal protein S21